MKLTGYYINLDSSVDRRQFFDNQINSLELNFQITRFSALTGKDKNCIIKNGELGCYLSHEEVINSHQDNSAILILEDDTILLPELKIAIHDILSEHGNRCDMIFLGSGIDYAHIPKMNELIKLKKQHIKHDGSKNISLLDAKRVYNHGTHAYIITPTGLPKIRAILEEYKLKNYPIAIDNLYRHCIHTNLVNALVTFPFLVELNIDFEPTIHGRIGVPDLSMGDESLYSAAANLFSINTNSNELLTWAFNNLQENSIDTDAFIASQIIYSKLKK